MAVEDALTAEEKATNIILACRRPLIRPPIPGEPLLGVPHARQRHRISELHRLPREQSEPATEAAYRIPCERQPVCGVPCGTSRSEHPSHQHGSCRVCADRSRIIVRQGFRYRRTHRCRPSQALGARGGRRHVASGRPRLRYLPFDEGPSHWVFRQRLRHLSRDVTLEDRRL